jgi:hypothetical protein
MKAGHQLTSPTTVFLRGCAEASTGSEMTDPTMKTRRASLAIIR